MSDFEDDFEEDVEPDQTVTIGYTAPPLPPDHWSLQPEYKKLKASMNEPEPFAEQTEVPKDDWYSHAASLAGCTNEETA